MKANRVMLRKWNIEDASSLAEGLNNKDVASDYGTKYPYTIGDAIEYIKNAIEYNKEKYAIVYKETGDVIGGCGVHFGTNSTSANIWIKKDMQGKGIGTEAFKLLLCHCFTTLGLNRLDNVFFSENIASQKMQEKLGSIIDISEETIEVNSVVKKKKRGFITKEDFEKG